VPDVEPILKKLAMSHFIFAKVMGKELRDVFLEYFDGLKLSNKKICA
jgi:hypothetical protein